MCYSCPQEGAICENGKIIARDNFYGFLKANHNEFEFILCPEQYCCNSKENAPCNSTTTCNFNREGVLCGKCRPDHFIGLASNDCFHNSECTAIRKRMFWTSYVSLSIIMAFILTFSKDIKDLLKYIALKIKVFLILKFSLKRKPSVDSENSETPS